MLRIALCSLEELTSALNIELVRRADLLAHASTEAPSLCTLAQADRLRRTDQSAADFRMRHSSVAASPVPDITLVAAVAVAYEDIRLQLDSPVLELRQALYVDKLYG